MTILIDLNQTQHEILMNLVQEEIIRIKSASDIQFRNQILASLKSLERKLLDV
jgi:hypothetical protein